MKVRYKNPKPDSKYHNPKASDFWKEKYKTELLTRNEKLDKQTETISELHRNKKDSLSNKL